MSKISYFDCNATTPLEPEVSEIIKYYMDKEYGNSGSRTHVFGNAAKQEVQNSRNIISDVVSCKSDEVYFTSGATESNNLVILGLRDYGEEVNKKHIISSRTEHQAVLEPLEYLKTKGWDITLVSTDLTGRINLEELHNSIRPDTLLCSIMHVNNETGVIQPIAEIAEILNSHDIYYHVDAAQSYGKIFESLQNNRIDLISLSAHKIYGPKGIGALIARRRKYKRPPLKPIIYGGGQEKGLRPGTLAVPLIAGLGEASKLAIRDETIREKRCIEIKEDVIKLTDELNAEINGSIKYALFNTLNFSIPGINSEAAIVALKDTVAISNGSACTSQNYELSHVLKAMGCSEDRIQGALRFSWCHMTEDIDWDMITEKLKSLY